MKSTKRSEKNPLLSQGSLPHSTDIATDCRGADTPTSLNFFISLKPFNFDEFSAFPFLTANGKGKNKNLLEDFILYRIQRLSSVPAGGITSGCWFTRFDEDLVQG